LQRETEVFIKGKY